MTSRSSHWYSSPPTQDSLPLSDAETARILILGDPGVGKSSLAYLLSHGSSPPQSRWSYERTIGCSTFVKTHTTSRECSSRPHSLWVLELLDVSGSCKHPASRMAFYQKFDGIIFVFDVTNKKSFGHLQRWIHEVYAMGDTLGDVGMSKSKNSFDIVRPTGLFGDTGASASHMSLSNGALFSASPSPMHLSSRTRMLSSNRSGHIPTLFIGNKTDLKPNVDTLGWQQEIAEQFSTSCIFMTTSFMSDGTQKQFDSFFDKVIESKCDATSAISDPYHARPSMTELRRLSSQESISDLSDDSGHRRRTTTTWTESVSPAGSYMWR